ncbi:MAG: hypothetical protein LBC43_01410 [Bifidobacteriaceae bacterium]|nr:hypothetical protein [Bifidobacteriaceae bacterium]
MINSQVLVTDAENFSIADPINPYYGDSGLDLAAAVQEHRRIINTVREIGIKVRQYPSPKTSQDGVYTANWALVRGNQAVLSRLPNVRKSEEAYAESILSDLGIRVHRVPADYRFSGQGDALAIGDYLLSGQKFRSDPEAQQFAAQTLGYDLVQLQCVPLLDPIPGTTISAATITPATADPVTITTAAPTTATTVIPTDTGTADSSAAKPVINAITGWPDSLFYDIDLAIAILSENVLAYCPAAFTPESQAKIESLPGITKLLVEYDEAVYGYALNLLSNGNEVILSNQCPNLTQQLQAHCFETIGVSAPELRKGGGFIRCITLTLAP